MAYEPEDHFLRSTDELRAFELENLWLATAGLSILAYCGEDEDRHGGLFPEINSEVVRLFGYAVLRSRAAEYRKAKKITFEDFARIHRALIDGQTDPELDKAYAQNDTSGFTAIFARMITAQGRYQFPYVQYRMGRSLAIYHELPSYFREELLGNPNYIDLPMRAKELLGLNYREVTCIGFAILTKLRKNYADWLRPRSSARISLEAYGFDKTAIVKDYLTGYFSDLQKNAQLHRSRVMFKPKQILLPEIGLELDLIKSYLSIFSNTTKELRALLNKFPYETGHLIYRVSPLERFPILACRDGGLLVPNLRFLETVLKLSQTIQSSMNGRESCYPSDLSDKEWAVLEPLMPEPSWFTHRPREHSWREILNGIFYITRAGCSWRMMPSDLPHWKTVYHYFRLWRKSGFLERLHTTLREKTRVKAGRDPYPTAGSVDSQSVKTSEKGGSGGTTGARRSRVAEGT